MRPIHPANAVKIKTTVNKSTNKKTGDVAPKVKRHPLIYSKCARRLEGFMKMKLRRTRGRGVGIWVEADLKLFIRYCRRADGQRYSERHVRRIVAAWREVDPELVDISLSVYFDLRRLRWVLMAARTSNLRWDGMPLFFGRDGHDRRTRTELSPKFEEMRLARKVSGAGAAPGTSPTTKAPPSHETPELGEYTQLPQNPERTERPKSGLLAAARVVAADVSAAGEDAHGPTQDQLPNVAGPTPTTAAPNPDQPLKSTQNLPQNWAHQKNFVPLRGDSLGARVHDILPAAYIRGCPKGHQPRNISCPPPGGVEQSDGMEIPGTVHDRDSKSLGGAEMPGPRPKPEPRQNRRFTRSVQRKAFALMPFLEFAQAAHGRPVGWHPKHAWMFCVTCLTKGAYESEIFSAWENAVLCVHRDNLDQVTRSEAALISAHAHRLFHERREKKRQKKREKSLHNPTVGLNSARTGK